MDPELQVSCNGKEGGAVGEVTAGEDQLVSSFPYVLGDRSDDSGLFSFWSVVRELQQRQELPEGTKVGHRWLAKEAPQGVCLVVAEEEMILVFVLATERAGWCVDDVAVVQQGGDGRRVRSTGQRKCLQCGVAVL
jgi:hypothetical protein